MHATLVKPELAMGAERILFYYFLFFIAFEVAAISPWISTHYEVAEKYNCLKKMDVFFDRAVLFKYADIFLRSWTGNGNFDCSTKVLSRTKDTGIISVIQKMKFGEHNDCLDYVKFSEGERPYCGDTIFGLNPGWDGKMPRPHRFISDYAGPFLRVGATYSYADAYDSYGRQLSTKERPDLVSPGAVVEPNDNLVIDSHIDSTSADEDQEMELIIAFTGFRDCDGPNVPDGWFNCGFGVCILMQYVGDGVVNCPFGDCRDEGSCELAIASSPLVKASQVETNEDDKVENAFINDTMNPNAKPAGLEPFSILKKEEKNFRKDMETLEEVKNIGESFRKHNGILERISDLIEKAVELFHDGKFVNAEVDLIRKNDIGINEDSK